jgi:hypothetical protein
MEDDILSSVPQTPQGNSGTSAGDLQSAVDADAPLGDRVFDITEDLNISPINDNPQAVVRSQVPAQNKPAPVRPTTPQNIPISGIASAPRFVAPPIKLPPQPPVETSIPKPIPAPPGQPRQPISIPLSDFTQSLQKAQSVSTPIIPQKNPAGNTSEDFFPKTTDLKALRTYESDVAEVLAHTRASTASIALAEAKKESGQDRIQNNEEADEPSTHAGLKITIIILCIVLVLAGIGGAYYFFSKSALAPATSQTPTKQTVQSLIPTDSQAVIAVDGLGPTAILSHITAEVAKPMNSNSIKEIIPSEMNAQNQRVRIAASEMLNVMEITPPDLLTRSLNSYWMLGVYSDPNGNKSAFVVVTTNFFQNSFAGMLQWENVMADDLKQYIGAGNTTGIANISPAPAPIVSATSTNTSSTTKGLISTMPGPSTLPQAQQGNSSTIQGHFEDRIIMNKDVRVFVTTDGRILFLYSFIDNTRLVIAGSEAALKEILTRLDNQTFIR